MSQRGYYGYRSQRRNSQPYYKRSYDGYVQVDTDGSCRNNGYPDSRAGYGVNFGDNHPM